MRRAEGSRFPLGEPLGARRARGSAGRSRSGGVECRGWVCWYFEAKTIRHTWHYSWFCRRGGGRRQLERLFDTSTSRDALLKEKVSVETPASPAESAHLWRTAPYQVKNAREDAYRYSSPWNEMSAIICATQKEMLGRALVTVCEFWPSVVTHSYSKQPGQPSVLIRSEAWWDTVGLGRRCYLLSCVCTGSKDLVLLLLMEMSCLAVPLCGETHLSLGK